MNAHSQPVPVWDSADYEFDFIAQHIFYPIYPIIAESIIQVTGSCNGKMLDIGCGGGHLGLALLEKTGHSGYFADINDTALSIGQSRAAERGLAQRCFFSNQDVHCLNFPDHFFDLVISRGSWQFWRDIEQALGEIYRVLAPGGRTYIGGGMGNSKLAASIREKMQVYQPGWPDVIQRMVKGITTEQIKSILLCRGIPHEIIENYEQGRWIIMKKA